MVNGYSYQINDNNINSIIYDIKMTFKLTGLGYNHQNIHTIDIDDESFNDIDVIKLLYSHRIHGRVSLIKKRIYKICLCLRTRKYRGRKRQTIRGRKARRMVGKRSRRYKQKHGTKNKIK